MFLNTLIVNYYERFSANESELKDNLLAAINKKLDYDQDELLETLLNIFRKSESIENDKKTEIINLKPTKLSEKQIIFIENNLLNNTSISSFYRNLFTSYSQTPQNYRELIIFKDNYDLLSESINKNKKVSIALKNGMIFNDASIYKIERSKEELFNYVLISNNNTPSTIRISKIKYVSLLNTKREISDEIVQIFERQIKYGVQYPFYSHNEEEVIVKMTKRGKDLFKKIYLYRPIPDRIEDDLYYFKCSHNQVSHYFKRFGYDAIIIQPLQLAESMNNYYFLASEKYKRKINKINKK